MSKLYECWKKVDIPNDLSPYGVKQEDIGFITDDTMQLKGALDQNPTPFYEKEISDVLTILIKG